MKHQLIQTITRVYTKSPRFVVNAIKDIRYKMAIKKAFDTFLTEDEKQNAKLKKENVKKVLIIVLHVKQLKHLIQLIIV